MTEQDKSNRRTVLGVLRLGTGSSAGEVAQRTGLSIPTASRVLKALVKDGAVRVALTTQKRTVYSLGN